MKHPKRNKVFRKMPLPQKPAADFHHSVYVILLDEAAAQMEKDLTADLRAQGYTVTGGT